LRAIYDSYGILANGAFGGRLPEADEAGGLSTVYSGV